jgi:hypothetical protein
LVKIEGKRGRKLKKKKLKKKKLFSKKELVTSVAIPLVIALIAGGGSFWAGHSQLKSSILSSEAQIKAAKISKVNTTEYDYKETTNWEVSQAREYFPLSKGNYWIYSGEYEGYSAKQDKYYTKNFEFKIKVKDEIKKGEVSLFILNNYFQDLASVLESYYDSSSDSELKNKNKIKLKESDCGLLLVANKLFYISNENLPKVKQALLSKSLSIDEPESEKSILDFSSLLFEFPLFKGQRFGDFYSITRSDLSYMWYVNDKRNVEILNNNTFETVPIYQLVYNTILDNKEIKFRPYVGVLSYFSSHHGVTGNLSLELKEYEVKESALK